MNRINNFINQETILTPAKTAVLLGGVAMSMLSPISIYNTWGAYNQNVFRAVFLANVIKSQKPDSAFSKLIAKSNVLTIPYFFGLTAYSIYSSAQIPKVITAIGSLREKLPSPAQMMEALQTIREKLPTQEHVAETLGTMGEKVRTFGTVISSQVVETLGSVREKLPSEAQVAQTLGTMGEKVRTFGTVISSQVVETLGSIREKLPSNMTEKAYELRERIYSQFNKDSLNQIYQQAAENKSYLLVGAIASVAVVSIISYCACRPRKKG
ncbi:MAG: hypothetical protein JSS30_04985 [Verrucomicrobia bacterium]|nr:hypothetical protein [Verrucomicrobiota bacterium]